MERAGQLQAVMPVCGAPQVSTGSFNGVQKTCGLTPIRSTVPQVSTGSFNGVQKTCGLTPIRSTVPQVSLGGYNGTLNNLGNYNLSASTGIQLPTNYQATPLPGVSGYTTPRGGNYSPRVELQNEPVVNSRNDSFFKWFFS